MKKAKIFLLSLALTLSFLVGQAGTIAPKAAAVVTKTATAVAPVKVAGVTGDTITISQAADTVINAAGQIIHLIPTAAPSPTNYIVWVAALLSIISIIIHIVNYFKGKKVQA